MRYTVPLILLLLAAPLLCQGNPFLTDNTDHAQASPPSIFGRVSGWSASFQRNMQETISGNLEDLRSGRGSSSLLLLLGAALLYGMVHALGPGHRKGVLAAYFLGRASAPLKGVAAGFLLALVHALSAVILVGGIYYLTRNALSTTVNDAQNLLNIITWGVILVLGGWMIRQGLGRRSGKEKVSERISFGGLIMSATVPCPGASAIMILAVSQNAFLLGVAAVLAMSAGMGLLLSLVGVAALFFRRGIKRLLSSPQREVQLERTLHVLSGTGMVLIALFMLMGLV